MQIYDPKLQSTSIHKPSWTKANRINNRHRGNNPEHILKRQRSIIEEVKDRMRMHRLCLIENSPGKNNEYGKGKYSKQR